MATNRRKSAAAEIAQVNTVTPANVAVGNSFTLTTNGKSITFIATAPTVANVTAGLASLVNSSNVPEFQELATADLTTSLRLTQRTPGKPFTQTSSASGGTATLATTTTTANSGPSLLDLGANWSTGSAPGGGDDLYLDNSDVPILYNLTAFAGLTFASWNQAASFGGAVGLPETDIDVAPYLEYRPQYLQCGMTVANIGSGPGQGCNRLKVDNGSVQTLWNVFATGSSAESNLETIQWKGTHAANVVNIYRGSFAAAGYGGDVATIATLRVGYDQSEVSDATVRCGPGCTLTNIFQGGGTLTINSAATAIVKQNGLLTVNGSGAVTTLTDNAGTTFWRSTGTLGTATLGKGATLSLAGDTRPKTITTVNLYAGSTFLDPEGTLTVGTVFNFVRCSPADCRIDLGPGRSISLAA